MLLAKRLLSYHVKDFLPHYSAIMLKISCHSKVHSLFVYRLSATRIQSLFQYRLPSTRGTLSLYLDFSPREVVHSLCQWIHSSCAFTIWATTVPSALASQFGLSLHPALLCIDIIPYWRSYRLSRGASKYAIWGICLISIMASRRASTSLCFSLTFNMA